MAPPSVWLWGAEHQSMARSLVGAGSGTLHVFLQTESEPWFDGKSIFGKKQPYLVYKFNLITLFVSKYINTYVYIYHLLISSQLTWHQQRNWPLDRGAHQQWNFPACPAQEDRWPGRRCTEHWGQGSSWPHLRFSTGEGRQSWPYVLHSLQGDTTFTIKLAQISWFCIYYYLFINCDFYDKKKQKTENLGLYFFLTWPEVKAIKAEGAEVISHPIATPGVAPCGPGQVALRAGPAHAQVSGLGREEGLHVIHSQLIVPSPGLGWILARSQEYVWSHAVVKYWTDSAKAEKVKLASAFFGYADENQYCEKNHKLENLFGMIAPDHSTTCPATYYLAVSGNKVMNTSQSFHRNIWTQIRNRRKSRGTLGSNFKLPISILRQNCQN